jgi:hypothetical protein
MTQADEDKEKHEAMLNILCELLEHPDVKNPSDKNSEKKGINEINKLEQTSQESLLTSPSMIQNQNTNGNY